jgi:site-specific DNA-adenine methylase
VDRVYCRETVQAWYEILQNTELFVGSWEDCPRGGVNYLDPPYRSSTTIYESGWSDCDLVELLERYKDAGEKVLICNRDDGSGYFAKWEDYYQVHTFPVSYTVGRNGKTAATEVLLVR